MKLYLDDERSAPFGWERVETAHEAIRILSENEVTDLSLDHDLGGPENGTGYDVIVWIEQQVAEYGYTPPLIFIHTANPAASIRMYAALDSIKKLLEHRNRI
jgi:hypothetical protein